ncbi:MAG TPA: hypothetical protein VFF88_01065, partial [Methylocella sp.]|nr:hypothetical protein [Methylocella sp.]
HACRHSLLVSTLLFDTLRLSRTLREKGHFTTGQAEALAEALGEAGHDGLATKADLAAVAAELKTGIAETKAGILKGIIGAIGFQTVVILAAMLSLARIFAK